MDRLTGYYGLGVKRPLPPDADGRVLVDLGEREGVRFLALVPPEAVTLAVARAGIIGALETEWARRAERGLP